MEGVERMVLASQHLRRANLAHDAQKANDGLDLIGVGLKLSSEAPERPRNVKARLHPPLSLARAVPTALY